MSRQGSSQSSNVLKSPALASSWHLGPSPPSFYGAANPSSNVSKPGASQHSIAHPFYEPSLLSLSQHSQPSDSQIPGTWSPQVYLTSQQGSRVASPRVNGHMQVLGHAAPTLSPIEISNVGQVPNQASANLLARTQEQQALLQIQRLAQQQQPHLHTQPVLQQRSSASLANPQNGERTLQSAAHHDRAEVVSTVSHECRQNSNEVWQEGVDEAEASVPHLVDRNEGQGCRKATQLDEGHHEHQAEIFSCNDGAASPQHAKVNEPLLDPPPNTRGVADRVTSQPGQSQSTYSSKCSQLNVNAPKFEPGKLKNIGASSFLGDKQGYKLAESESLNPSYPNVRVQAPNEESRPSKWNVAAPEFMPKSLVTATVPSQEFSFSALRPSLRPDAPAFEPSDSRSASGLPTNGEQRAVQPTKKIFGDINFSEVIKPQNSKAIPVIQPTQESNSQSRSDENLDGQEDDTGRITQADGRQKRVRYVGRDIYLILGKHSLKAGKELLRSLCYLNMSCHPILCYELSFRALPLLHRHGQCASKRSNNSAVCLQKLLAVYSLALSSKLTLRLKKGMLTLKYPRLKRDDGDQVPLFASPEGNQPWTNRSGEDRAAYLSRTPSPKSDALDATTQDAATDLLEGLIDDLSTTEASDLMREEESVDEDRKKEEHNFDDPEEVASFHAARPPDPHEVSDLAKLNPLNLTTADYKKLFGSKVFLTLSICHYSSLFFEEGMLRSTSLQVARATQDFLNESPEFTTAFDRALRRRTSSSGSASPSTKNKIERCEHRYQEGTEDSVDIIDHVGQDTHLNIMNGVRYVEPSHNELGIAMKHLDREDSGPGVKRPSNPWRSPSPTPSPIQCPGPKLHDLSTAHQLLPSANLGSDAPSHSPNRMQESRQQLPPTNLESANPSFVTRYSPSYSASKISPPIEPSDNPSSTPPSDWNDGTSSMDEDKSHSKITFKNRVGEVMQGIVQRELQPLEQALVGIQQSLAQLPDRSASRRSHSSGAHEIEHSDADDEDDADEVSHSRLKSPFRDRKFEQLKASISKIAAAQQGFEPGCQLAEMLAAVKDLKSIIQKNASSTQLSGDLKSIVEEAVGRQMRGRSAPVTSSSQAAAAERSQLQIVGLESMLKIADARANDELQARRSVEDELADKTRSLRIALQEAAEHRESAEATERSLRDFHTERQQTLQRNATLENSQESLQKTASDLSEKNSALEDTLAEYRLSSDQWRSEISDVKHENKDLKRKVTSMNSEIEANDQGRRALQAKVDHLQGEVATASRNFASDHMKWLSKEEEYKARLEILSVRMEAEAGTRERLKHEIERIEAQEMETTKVSSMVEQLQEANAHLENLSAELRSQCNDHQSMIVRLRQQIDLVTTDADRSRSRYEVMLEEVSNSRSAALEEAARFHESAVREVKAQHERELNNASEDKQRSETHFGEKLNLADEKVAHYQDRVSNLEEKLEIAKSAAYAAVQAAQSKKAVLNSSSPRTSLPMAEASNRASLPEKISPQALRESILVLQEQLQERETRIEQLENRLSSVDTIAPERLKNAEIEITWLRELLEIRIEDLDDLIATVSQPFYNPESVKDAAIRLKANLQMEQQEKGRALTSLPSFARISSIAASPKSVPLAAAAAWGNWRKGRDSIFANQTPSKSSTQSLLPGLMTPPNTELRTPFDNGGLLSSKGPVKASTKSKESLPHQKERGRLLECQPQQDPVTPPLLRKGSYDLDANESTKIDGDNEPFGPNLGGIVGRM